MKLNFSYGIIAIVGVLAAISIGFIAMSPNDIIEPRVSELNTNKIAEIKKVLKEISVNPSIASKSVIAGDSLVFEVEFRDDGGFIVDHVNYDVFATQNDETILSDPESHRHPGKHPIHETTILSESLIEIQVVFQGLGHGDDIFGTKGIITTSTLYPEVSLEEPELEPEQIMCTTDYSPVCGVDGMTYSNSCNLDASQIELDYVGECVVLEPEPTPEPETQSSPSTTIVSIPAGSAVPGCEDTNECYLPYEVTISSGSSVSWINDDSAAHTVTSGILDAGIDGVFDSSLFMAGAVYEFTFEEAGTFDYFCLVHPWMIGVVNVN